MSLGHGNSKKSWACAQCWSFPLLPLSISLPPSLWDSATTSGVGLPHSIHWPTGQLSLETPLTDTPSSVLYQFSRCLSLFTNKVNHHRWDYTILSPIGKMTSFFSPFHLLHDISFHKLGSQGKSHRTSDHEKILMNSIERVSRAKQVYLRGRLRLIMSLWVDLVCFWMSCVLLSD
jgi:hypothetical protein